MAQGRPESGLMSRHIQASFSRVHRNWKLRHWETPSHLQENNPLWASDNYPQSADPESGQSETPMKWTSQDPPSSPLLIGQWCAGGEALDRRWGLLWKEFPWMSFGTLGFIWRLGRAVLREERGVRRAGRPTVSMRRKRIHIEALLTSRRLETWNNTAIKERQQDSLRARNTDSHALVSLEISSHLPLFNGKKTF